MDNYIGIGFIILCFAVLAGMLGILGYQFHKNKENVDISPAKTNINKSNKDNDWDKGSSLVSFYLFY